LLDVATVHGGGTLPLVLIIGDPTPLAGRAALSESADTLVVVLVNLLAEFELVSDEARRNSSACLGVRSELSGIRVVIGPEAFDIIPGASADIVSLDLARVTESVDSPVSANLVEVFGIVGHPSVMALGTSLVTIAEVHGDVSDDLFRLTFDDSVTLSPSDVLNGGHGGVALAEASRSDMAVRADIVGRDRHSHHLVLELVSERLEVLRAILLDGDGVVTLGKDGLDGEEFVNLTIRVSLGPELGLDAVRL